MQTLEDVAIYLASFPHKNKRLTQERYVRYHVEHYYQEAYILQNRLEVLSKRIGRAYRNTEYGQAIKSIAEGLTEVLRLTISEFVAQRGKHVHVERLDDIELRRFSALELLAAHDNRLAPLARAIAQRLRKDTSRWVKHEARRLAALVNGYFGALRILMFTESGELRFPSARSA